MVVEMQEKDEVLEKMLQNFKTIELKHNVSGQQVKIYEMVHIAPQSFYDDRQKNWAEDFNNGFEIHIEGIKNVDENKKGLMDYYAKIAELTGYAVQEKPEVEFISNDTEYDDLSFLLKKMTNITIKGMDNIEPGDKTAIKMKKSMDKMLFNSRDSRGIKFLNSKVFKLVDSKIGLVEKRNKIAVEGVLNTFNNVSLIWGQAHVPGIIELLEKSGFSIVN